MTEGETTRGVPLNGVADRVMANFFMVGVADMQRNIPTFRGL